MKKNILVFLAFVLCFSYGCNYANNKVTADYERDYLILVNKDNPYDKRSDYAQNLTGDLMETFNAETGDDEFLEYKTLAKYYELHTEARKQGIEIGIVSGYYDSGKNGLQYPEHCTGLNIKIAIDGYLGKDGPYWLEEGEDIPENETLTSILPDFGFIRRYPEGKESITGHDGKVSEIRYVGSPDVAHAIMDQGITLEEYVAKHHNTEK